MNLKNLVHAIIPSSSHGHPDVEEGCLKHFRDLKWYPAVPGKHMQDGYSIAVKLGYGTTSTVWFVIDWERSLYAVAKIHAANVSRALEEIKALDKLRGTAKGHPGARLIRNYLNTCQVSSSLFHKHRCIIYSPLGPSLGEVRRNYGGRIPVSILNPMIRHMLLALDYLHRVCCMINNDIHSGNFLMQLRGPESLEHIHLMERSNPSVPHVKGRYTIYESRRFPMASMTNIPMLCDLGAAVNGDQNTGDPTPDLMRPPEVILRIPWSNKIDIWFLGLVIWHCVQGRQWYQYKHAPRKLTELELMAWTVALLGTPSQKQFARMAVSKRRAEFFTGSGQFRQSNIVPRESMMDRERALAADHEERKQFVLFLSRMLQWDPDSRASAAELLLDPWIR